MQTRPAPEPGPQPGQPPSPRPASQPGRGQRGAANHRGPDRRRADLSATPRPRPAAIRHSLGLAVRRSNGVGRGAQCETEIAGGARAQERGRGAEPCCVCALGPIVRLCSQASGPTLVASRGSSRARPRERYCWVLAELFRAVDGLCPSAHARRGRGTCREARGSAGRAFPTGHAPLGMRSALPRLF